MKYGFIKVAAGTPDVKPADCEYNVKNIINMIKEAEVLGVKILVLPELCVTGYTCGDLFLQDTLITAAEKYLKEIVDCTLGIDMLVAAGLPIQAGGKLYNVAAVMQNGNVLAFIPKTHIPNYSEFYESRYFTKGDYAPSDVEFNGNLIPMGSKILFSCAEIKNLITAVEICEDLWVMRPLSGGHAEAGAIVILNCSASNELILKDDYRRELIKNQSARLMCAYLYADAGEGESTTDLVFAGHNIISENGSILAESERFKNELIVTEIDIEKLNAERRKMTTYIPDYTDYRIITYSLPSLTDACWRRELSYTKLTRYIDPMPFVPAKNEERKKRCKDIIMIQAMGLKKRLLHTNYRSAVIGISGGLDSTLALLVTIKAFELAGYSAGDITAVTMPCFGTTNRTYKNAVSLIKELSASFKEINISNAVTQHLKDISHDIDKQDIVYENAQARERTQVLMDIANELEGMVIGTGDLSELALGFATYNGDHMSMYAINASIPKTLIRCLIEYFIEDTDNERLKEVLIDILDTPVSPELIPPVNNEAYNNHSKNDKEIIQKTEDIVGPYELHDFFLYYMLRFGHRPSKILYLAENAFAGKYEREVILKWMKVFYKRFFSQQFKRSCLPDGPKVGSVAISPRGDLRMPSDASVTLWMREIEEV